MNKIKPRIRRTKKERALACEIRSANFLARANELKEHGEIEKAERFYARATEWLCKANDILGL